MRALVKISLPDEVMERLPAGKAAMEAYLSPYAEEAVEVYSRTVQKQAPAPFNQALNRFERSLVKDFIMRTLMGDLLQKGGLSPAVEEPISAVK